MKNKYYVVDIESQAVLGEFTNVSDANIFRMEHKCTQTTQVWGFHPSELRPAQP